MTRRLSILFLALLASACATTASRPPQSGFADIPVPRGLTYQPGMSTVIESPAVKAAQLVYRGRLEPVSLAQAMRATLEANGWRFASASSTSTLGTIQVYEKAGKTLQVRIYKGLWYTYLELEASRAEVVSR